MYDFNTISDLLKMSKDNDIPVSEVVIRREKEKSEKSIEEIKKEMQKRLSVMKEAKEKGLNEDLKSASGLVNGDAKLLAEYTKNHQTVGGGVLNKAIANSLAVSELNASMGKIVAAPTAGSCGIIPGTLLTIADEREIGDERIINSLFVASGIGIVIGEKASLSGATAGCQAECGSASAMAAGSIADLLGDCKDQIDYAVSTALSNLLGLICDPVAGLVEIPCIKRNSIGTSNALISADMALAGIENKIPADEVIEAMQEVGNSLPEELKETSKGGLATTPTGEEIRDRIQKESD